MLRLKTAPVPPRTAGSVVALLIAGAASLAAGFDHNHAAWTRVLERRVEAGRVDYAAIRADPAALTGYLDTLAAVGEEEFNSWSQPRQIAFLVNLYNASTIRLITLHYPVDSIKKIGWFLKGPFDQDIVRLFNAKTTLNHIEHERLRRDYSEPRIHFALVCAAVSCPSLRSEAYVGDRLDAQFDEQGRLFLADRTKNRLDTAEGTLYLSPIFKWFRDDFTAESRSVALFVKPFLPPDDRARLEEDTPIRFTDYDWSLNDSR